MALSNRDRVGKSLDLLKEGLKTLNSAGTVENTGEDINKTFYKEA